ncbi:phosphotransferase [Fertoebacter nigrum]|uniref:Phosphotransferase n=1 Tax=Fertoeibacter niger TaxID=2656921 RepID=A0A8X8GVC1_9RHOB|nr:phosphotransferase [Fertoeibacter niger]NUB43812.1 phosphotransferase [Fertoeibacter niger]
MTDFTGLAAWGDVAVQGPLAGGARSALWRVEVNGQACVARRNAEGVAALRWLARVLAAAQASGLVVPMPCPARDGRLAVAGWTVEPYLAGQSALPAELPALAAPLARFHRRTAGFPQRPGWHPPGLPQGVGAQVRRVWPEGRQAVIHGDLHAGNVLRLPCGRLALLDWEEARRDAPAIDRAALAGFAGQRRLHAAVEVLACWRAEPARARAMARTLRNWT